MPVWLEIGFGAGEHLVHLAQSHPDVGIVGVEAYINGVAALLGKLRKVGPDNVRIHPGDVRELFDVLPPACLDRVYLLYPDPWPKKKHHRRRFVTPDYLEPLSAAMATGAELRIATDIPDYVRQTLEELTRHGGFEWLGTCADDWRLPWEGWTRTRFEAKAIRGGAQAPLPTISAPLTPLPAAFRFNSARVRINPHTQDNSTIPKRG